MEFRINIDVGFGKVTVNGMPVDMPGGDPLNKLAQAFQVYCNQTSRKLNGTFNKGVFWPAELEFALKCELRHRYQVIPTIHLLERLHEYQLPMGCYTAALYGEVIEAEVEDGVVKKIVTRLPNRTRPDEDICAAICLMSDEYDDHLAKVVTAWCNDRRDMHYTLKKENYVQSF